MAKEEIERGNWTGKLDFILSCIGYAVGLGNVWRFPYLCYRNGGGAFLVPYAIMLVIAGIPLFFFELSFGQFASEGPVTVWKVSPFFMGIGWAMCLISAMVSIYYNVIIMYSIYYMFVSFVSIDTTLPWQTCTNIWNTENCRIKPYPKLSELNEINKTMELIGLNDKSCLNKTVDDVNSLFGTSLTSYMEFNSTMLQSNVTKQCEIKFRTASEEFWTRQVLQLQETPDGLYDIGDVSIRNLICLLFAWIFIFFCLMKGVKSSGKVVYFTATFPYIVLLMLLIRGVTLEGYYDGILFYIIPKWEEISKPKVWGDAATQIFYSLGVAFGGLLTMASYNKFKNNTLRDALLVSLINCSTSVFAGFAIFSLLGHMAFITNRLVEEVADSGPGLAFVAYPEGIAKLAEPWPPIVAFLFFFMIFTLGLDSQFAMMETVISGLSDVFPYYLRKHKTLFTFVTCMIGFLLGIPQVCKGGIYVLTLMDWYSGSYNLMIVSLCELVAVCYVYGVNNFRRDIEMMLGGFPKVFWVYWYVTWCFITPVAIVFIVIMSGITYAPAYYTKYEGVYTFPDFAEGLGWLMVVSPLALIVGGMIVQSIRYGGVAKALKVQPDWGPALDENRTGRYSPRDEPDFSKDEPAGATNLGYMGEKGRPYVVNDKNGYDHRL